MDKIFSFLCNYKIFSHLRIAFHRSKSSTQTGIRERTQDLEILVATKLASVVLIFFISFCQIDFVTFALCFGYNFLFRNMTRFTFTFEIHWLSKNCGSDTFLTTQLSYAYLLRQILVLFHFHISLTKLLFESTSCS